MNKIAKTHQTPFNERKDTVLVWDLCFQHKPIKNDSTLMGSFIYNVELIQRGKPVKHSWKREFNFFGGKVSIMKKDEVGVFITVDAR